MDRPFFEQELARLRAIAPKTWDDRDEAKKAAYMDELWRRFGSFDSYRWQRMMNWVLDHRDSSNALPPPTAWTDASNATKPTGEEYRGPTVSRELRRVWMLEEIKAMKPETAWKIMSEHGEEFKSDEIVWLALASRAGEAKENARPQAATVLSAVASTTVTANIDDDELPEF